MPNKPKQKNEKAWAVVCNKESAVSAFTKKPAAVSQKKDLDDTYGGYCKHKIIPCIITYKTNE